MKQELKNHFLPLLAIFIVTSLIWFLQKTVWYNYVFLFFGFLWGSFFLDIDHLIHWFYLEPNLDESHLAKTAWKKGDFKSLLKLLEATHMHHTNLIFHHYFFQIIITLISIFVFTSSSNIFAKAFLLAINIHLLTDEIKDFYRNPDHLKLWLFAREKKQLPTESLKYYLLTFLVINSFFTIFLISSR